LCAVKALWRWRGVLHQVAKPLELTRLRIQRVRDAVAAANEEQMVAHKQRRAFAGSQPDAEFPNQIPIEG
jgi:hypothetical protein